jgi:hypothetical protein
VLISNILGASQLKEKIENFEFRYQLEKQTPDILFFNYNKVIIK